MASTADNDPFDFSDFGGVAAGVASDDSPRHQQWIGSNPGLPDGITRVGGFDPFAAQRPTGGDRARGEQAFDGSSAGVPSTGLSIAGPPLMLFAAAFAVAGLGALIALLALPNAAVLSAFSGWLLAGPAAIGILAWFSHVDTRRRLSSVYSAPTWLRSAYWVLVGLCAVGIALGAWQIALWAGRF